MPLLKLLLHAALYWAVQTQAEIVVTTVALESNTYRWKYLYKFCFDVSGMCSFVLLADIAFYLFSAFCKHPLVCLTGRRGGIYQCCIDLPSSSETKASLVLRHCKFAFLAKKCH